MEENKIENETDNLDDLNEVKEENKDSFEWWIIIFLIFVFAGFGIGCKDTYEKLDRKCLIHKINESDISNSEKRKLIEILLM